MRGEVERVRGALEHLRGALERRLLRAWFGTGPGRLDWLARVLQPLSALTSVIARRRRAQIRRLSPGARPAVVVVGNLVAGGAGKTPLTIALARALAERGWRVGILAGGYRAVRSDPRLVAGDDDAREHGDEAVLLARSTGLPVAAGRKRADALSLLIERHPDLDLVVSDDGLQHGALPRSVELAVFDARGAGNGLMLPAGPLREPLEHVDAMDAIVLNGTAAAPRAHRRQFVFTVEPAGLQRVDGTERCAPAEFARRFGRQQVAALAGIAQPARFFTTLAGVIPHFEQHPLGDHATIDAATLRALHADVIVMTEKDAVKCAAFADRRCWALGVRARIDPGLVKWLEEHLNGQSTA